MLPSLHRLAPTGEFYALPRHEAQKLNEEDDGDPMTGELFPANCHRDSRNCEPTFRVWVADPATGNKGTDQYYVYFARALWDWYQRQPTDPNNRQICWSEDWWALRAKYDPNGDVPEWVAHMPNYNRVRQLDAEKRRYLQDLEGASRVLNGASYIYLHGLAQVLYGPDGTTLYADGTVGNPVEEHWMARFLYEKALRVARWLLEADVLGVITHHLGTGEDFLGDPSQHKWAVMLLHALLRALTPRAQTPDRTEREAVIDRILTMPDLLHRLVSAAHGIAERFRVRENEQEWELKPILLLWWCAKRALRNDDTQQFMALATDKMLDALELVFRPLIDEDNADRGYGYRRRYNSKALALEIVQCISLAVSPQVRLRLLRKELLLSVTKFSVLQLDANDQHFEEDEAFRSMAVGVLRRLEFVSPRADAMVNEVRFEVTGEGGEEEEEEMEVSDSDDQGV